MNNTKISYSRGISKFDNKPDQREAADFEAFAKAIIGDVGVKKGQQYVCAPFTRGFHDKPDKYQGEEPWRLKKLVIARRWMPFDYDGFKDAETCKQWRKWIESENYSAVIYTTASHTKEAPRARAIFELSRPVTREESIRLGAAFEKAQQKELGVDFVKFDKSVYQSEQPCYLPVKGFKSKIFSGVPLDVDVLLQKQIPATQLSTLQACLSADPESPRRVAIVREMLSHINADCDYPTYRDVIWAVADTGWSCAYDLVRGWSLTAPHRFDEDVLSTIFNSFTCTGGVHFGTLVHHSREGGWCGY